MHGAKKAHSVHSHLRKNEIVQEEEPGNFDEYEELLAMPLENHDVQALRLDEPPEKYLELEAEGILPPWPGPGYVFRAVCAPAHRSDTDRSAYKTPMVFVLDDDSSNPLNCTDVYKRVGCLFCYNCPSTNGSISSCCHLAYAVILFSASYMLETCVNKGVRLVNIKNPFSFLHPDEVMSHCRSVSIPKNVQRTSVEKRPNDPLYDPAHFLYLVDEETEEGDVDQSAVIDISPDSADVLGQSTVPQALNPDTHAPDVPSQSPVLTAPNHEAPDSSSRASAMAQSTTSSVSFYGQGVANIERFIQTEVRKVPNWVIPLVNPWRGK